MCSTDAYVYIYIYIYMSVSLTGNSVDTLLVMLEDSHLICELMLLLLAKAIKWEVFIKCLKTVTPRLSSLNLAHSSILMAK